MTSREAAPALEVRVASPPAKPFLIFDGECRFCRRWIARWKRATGEWVEYAPYPSPEVAERFPGLPRELFEQSVRLIETDGRVYGGAEAVFRALAFAPYMWWPLRLYEKYPRFASLSERAYGFVAGHRRGLSRLTR